MMPAAHLPGMAQSLIRQGLPAVIAMQFEITDEAAIIFAHELYAAIADGYPVEAALAEARRAILHEGNHTEWGTPVLYSRAPDGHLFNLTGQARMSEAPREDTERRAQQDLGARPAKTPSGAPRRRLTAGPAKTPSGVIRS